MRIGVLASGGGTNLQSIIDNSEKYSWKVGIVISNNEDAYALERARRQGIKSVYLETPENMLKYKPGTDIEEIMKDPARRDYDILISELLDQHKIKVVALAGYMLFVTPELINNHDIINIHPALLPSFKGLHGVRDTYNYAVRITGCTTHFVDDKEDHGPIILQAFTPVFPYDTEESLIKRNLKREHLLYPETLRLYGKGVEIKDRRVLYEVDDEHVEFQNKLLEMFRGDFGDYYTHGKQK